MSDDEQQQQQQAAGVAAAALSLATTELEYRVELLNRCDVMMLTVQAHRNSTAHTRPACFACCWTMQDGQHVLRPLCSATVSACDLRAWLRFMHCARILQGCSFVVGTA